MASPPTKVTIHVSNQRAYVLDVKDVEALRAQHHICGLLTGTLPHLSQQNVFLGVPLLLTPEEVVTLVDAGVAVLVDNRRAHRIPSAEELHFWSDKQREERDAQLSQLELSKKSVSIDKAQSEEAIRKRQERLAKRAALVPKTEDALFDPAIQPTPEGLEVKTPEAPAASVSVSAITIPTTSQGFAWYDHADCVYESIDAAKNAGIWTYPSNLHERARCGVFGDLWRSGYYMGGGLRFGGDYLVYPGDPLRYHSHFVATVLESPTKRLRPMEIVAFGRLGTATKKSHLLCGWDDEKKVVDYYSIEWAGFG